MSSYAQKYNLGLNGQGYIISQKKGIRYYQKKRAPLFVNKFGSGDSSYRDATFWQFFVQTNFRNGAKQLKFDDAGKFWKSSDVDTTILEQLTLSKKFESVGQIASGVEANCLEAWRNSVSWWDSNYGYRQQLTFTNNASASAPIGYPVKITIDTAALETASKVRSDRKDWRVVYSNGSSLVELNRDYVSTTATFFALQAAIAAGSSDSNYYIYYGYASEATTKQPSTEDEWNAVYGMYGTTPDANSVAIFHMREGSGTSVNDDSASTNTGTLTGSPAWATDGKFGRAVDFDGSNDKMSLANLSLGSFTMEGWFYFDALGGDQTIAAERNSSTGNAFWFYVNSSKKLTINGNTLPNVSGTTTLQNSTWYHLAATCDGSVMKLFVNGSQEGSQSSGALVASNQNYYLAARDTDGGSFGNFVNGKAQHIRFSNTARSSFPYVLSAEPTMVAGSETSTQPPSSTFDLYAGGSDGKVYKWDGTTSWVEQFDTRQIVWYETGNDANELVGDDGGTEKAKSQGFQVSTSVTVAGASVYIKKNVGTPGDITVRIETDSTNKPSGTLADANATGTIPAFTTTSYGWVEVAFAGVFSLSASTTYHLVLKTAAAANDNNYAWAADASSPTFSSGAQSYSANGGSAWTADSTKDQYFRLLGNATQVNCMMVTSLGGTQRLYLGTGDPNGQTNGDARLYSFNSSAWALTKTFATSTEAQISSITEYSTANKVYLGIGPQAKVYETSDFSTFTISKDINVPQNPGYVYALKEYNRVLHVGGGSPEFLPAQKYNGFLNVYDTTAWNILYPFDFTVIKSLEFYDAYLFMGTYHGHLYVYDTSTLNPLFNFKDQYNYKVSVLGMKYFNDKLYLALYPQDNSNETNVGIWLFDRRGLSLAHTIDGPAGYRCFAVVNGALFVGTGSDGYVYRLNDDVYKDTGWVQLSYFDANLPSIDKLWNNVTIRHEALLNGHSITMYYRFKETDDWTLLGTSDTVGDIEKTFSFATGTTSKKITLKAILSTSDSGSSPTLTEVVMEYALYPTRKWQWNLKIKATKNLRLLDGSFETRTAEEIRQDIEELLGSEMLYVFNDVNGESFNVLVHDIDTSSWVINSDDTNEEEVSLTLLEA